MKKRHRGIFLADALFGTMIAVVVTTSLLAVASSEQRASRKLADSRSDSRALESALIQVQSGKPVPAGVTIQAMDNAAAPQGWRWVNATTGDPAHPHILRGLIPATGGVK